jgi:hypothetical protein
MILGWCEIAEALIEPRFVTGSRLGSTDAPDLAKTSSFRLRNPRSRLNCFESGRDTPCCKNPGNQELFFVLFQAAQRFRCAAAIRARAFALMTRFFAGLLPRPV